MNADALLALVRFAGCVAAFGEVTGQDALDLKWPGREQHGESFV